MCYSAGINLIKDIAGAAVCAEVYPVGGAAGVAVGAEDAVADAADGAVASRATVATVNDAMNTVPDSTRYAATDAAVAATILQVQLKMQ